MKCSFQPHSVHVEDFSVYNKSHDVIAEDCPSVDSTSERKYRKQRTVFEPSQIAALEDMFSKNQYPSSEDYDKLSCKISIDEQRLRIWFQNRRARHRRLMKSSPAHLSPMSPLSIPSALSMSRSALTAPQFPDFPPPHLFYGKPPFLPFFLPH